MQVLIVFQYCGEFDNWGAIMSVSGELLCSFELLKPLDSTALKNHIKKGRNKRNSMLNSPVSCPLRSVAWPASIIVSLPPKSPQSLTVHSLRRCQLRATKRDSYPIITMSIGNIPLP